MNRLNMTALLAALFAGVPAVGDWLDLEDGRSLRGIDARKEGKRYRFTLESGIKITIPASRVVAVRKSPRDEMVEFRGEAVTLRRKVRTLVEERRLEDRRRLRVLETWARGKKGSPEAAAEIRALPDAERTRLFGRALLKSQNKEARLIAAREIAGCDAEIAVRALSAAAVSDSYRSVRDTSLRMLRLFDGHDVSGRFLPYLASRSPQRRIRAANALSLYPDSRAVPAILQTMRLSWSGFGRSFFSQVTQRAYIADYELVSGGTGFSIVEVADPIVRTSQTGVALDVSVRKVEMVVRIRALVKITGKDFGTDLAAWKRWWKAENQ